MRIGSRMAPRLIRNGGVAAVLVAVGLVLPAGQVQPAPPIRPHASATAQPVENSGPSRPSAGSSSPPATSSPPVSAIENPATSHSGIEVRALTEEARQYCVNIRDAAVDARLAWQTATLAALEKQVADQIVALEVKRSEYEMWLRKRQDFLQQARDDVVAIYARMRPDAAAGQLASMDDDTAAAVLAKLNARSSSAILNEMEPARAALLANRLAGVYGLSTKGEKL